MVLCIKIRPFDDDMFHSVQPPHEIRYLSLVYFCHHVSACHSLLCKGSSLFWISQAHDGVAYSPRAGKPISGSPFMCHVGAGEVDAGNSRLFGPGLQAVQLGRESQLFCELADAFGNKVESAAANNGADLRVLDETFVCTSVHTDLTLVFMSVTASCPLQSEY